MKNMKHNKIREGEAEKEETEPLWPHLGFFYFFIKYWIISERDGWPGLLN